MSRVSGSVDTLRAMTRIKWPTKGTPVDVVYLHPGGHQEDRLSGVMHADGIEYYARYKDRDWPCRSSTRSRSTSRR